MLRIVKAGLQATLQGKPRTGWRHMGLPASGPADEVSMALANRLVENPPYATCIEISFGGFRAEIEQGCSIAVTGATGRLSLSGEQARAHETLHLKAGTTLSIEPPSKGVRAYLAIASGFKATEQFGSTSTYLPAQIGGLNGRTLKEGDRLSANRPQRPKKTYETPDQLRPRLTNSFAIRTCPSAEIDALDDMSRQILFSESFSAGRQMTRMGLALDGHLLSVERTGLMKSAPVFPGTIQCPPSGTPIVLSCDAQTTGGYPRIASVARCDRHLLGQVRPGDKIRLLERTHEAAANDYIAKRDLLQSWLLD